MRILIVEDNARLAGFLAQGLSGAGFAPDIAGTGDEARAAIKAVAYDAVVLDLGLPDVDGLELIAELRGKGSKLPILVLTARDDVRDRVSGLNRGADDYVIKPVALEELVARLRALLRRPVETHAAHYTVANLAFNASTREVRIDGRVAYFAPRELAILEQLIRRTGQVVPKPTLEEKLYGFTEEASANSVEATLSRLRKSLRDRGAAVTVHTFRGLGYLLQATE